MDVNQWIGQISPSLCQQFFETCGLPSPNIKTLSDPLLLTGYMNRLDAQARHRLQNAIRRIHLVALFAEHRCLQRAAGERDRSNASNGMEKACWFFVNEPALFAHAEVYLYIKAYVGTCYWNGYLIESVSDNDLKNAGKQRKRFQQSLKHTFDRHVDIQAFGLPVPDLETGVLCYLLRLHRDSESPGDMSAQASYDPRCDYGLLHYPQLGRLEVLAADPMVHYAIAESYLASVLRPAAPHVTVLKRFELSPLVHHDVVPVDPEFNIDHLYVDSIRLLDHVKKRFSQIDPCLPQARTVEEGSQNHYSSLTPLSVQMNVRRLTASHTENTVQLTLRSPNYYQLEDIALKPPLVEIGKQHNIIVPVETEASTYQALSLMLDMMERDAHLPAQILSKHFLLEGDWLKKRGFLYAEHHPPYLFETVHPRGKLIKLEWDPDNRRYTGTRKGYPLYVEKDLLAVYRVNRTAVFQWIQESLGVPGHCQIRRLKPNVWELGTVRLGRQVRALLFVQQYNEPGVKDKLDQTLKTYGKRNHSVVMTTTRDIDYPQGDESPYQLVPLHELLTPDSDHLSRKWLASFLFGEEWEEDDCPPPPRVEWNAEDGVLIVNENEYRFKTPAQRTVVSRLYQAWLKGQPKKDMLSLLRDLSYRHISEPFRHHPTWRSVIAYASSYVWLKID